MLNELSVKPTLAQGEHFSCLETFTPGELINFIFKSC